MADDKYIDSRTVNIIESSSIKIFTEYEPQDDWILITGYWNSDKSWNNNYNWTNE